MKLSLVERETILLYNQAEPMAEVYTHDPHLMEKLIVEKILRGKEKVKSMMVYELKK